MTKTEKSQRERLALYAYLKVNITRLRTGSDPCPGKVVRVRSSVDYVKLYPSDVRKFGLLGAIANERQKHIERLKGLWYAEAVRQGIV